MEICGGQTLSSIVRFGIDELLPKQIRLVHGPGCPVCVTPLELIDKAFGHRRSLRPDVIFCSFGDMLRALGSDGDLFSVKSSGGDVRIVYSPLDAVKLARQVLSQQRSRLLRRGLRDDRAGQRNVAVYQAKKQGIHNFSIPVSHVLVPPAMEAILGSYAEPGAGLPGSGSCVRHHGLHRSTEPCWPSATACRWWSPLWSRWTSRKAST
ncbi:MAG: hypothetical protein R2873_22330 [Caldilineaceae bacterium]